VTDQVSQWRSGACGATCAAHTAGEYVRAITAREADRQARAAFQTLALRLAPTGGVIYDFGAGPGIDAHFFAEHGFTVRVYDTDPRMREYLAGFCRDLIDAGAITIEEGSYRVFLNSRDGGAPSAELVTANFAPLNLVDDLPALFAKFAALTVPGGKVLASVLNPYFAGDMKYGWWWRNAVQLWRRGHFSLPGAGGNIVRRRIADFAMQCAPYFMLQRVFRGLPPRNPREEAGIDPARINRGGWTTLATSQYLFLLFCKTARDDV
jgi:SAM-dependent methyltransferase